LSTDEPAAAWLAGLAREAARPAGQAFAAANIALCKYWGKRDEALNLPVTSSLSVSLGELGTRTVVTVGEHADAIRLNGEDVPPEAGFARRASRFLDLVRPAAGIGYRVDTRNALPTGAGLASSASGFAALALALDHLYGWELDARRLSILARLGSGSASRSIEAGFVEWHAGTRPDGLDSFAEALPEQWPELRIGLLTVSAQQKAVSSREAMQRTRLTSALYPAWPAKAQADLELLRRAIRARDFELLGRTAESNALAMHATSLAAQPPVLYWLPQTIVHMHDVWGLREQGTPVHFTIDAGANLKLLFLARDAGVVAARFPGVRVVAPFA